MSQDARSAGIQTTRFTFPQVKDATRRVALEETPRPLAAQRWIAIDIADVPQSVVIPPGTMLILLRAILRIHFQHSRLTRVAVVVVFRGFSVSACADLL